MLGTMGKEELRSNGDVSGRGKLQVFGARRIYNNNFVQRQIDIETLNIYIRLFGGIWDYMGLKLP